jgi:nucleotide-binding universal stress UspA family protein
MTPQATHSSGAGAPASSGCDRQDQRGAREPDAACFPNVLVGVDGTPSGRDAIALAEQLRDECGRLTLAHVVVDLTPSYTGLQPAASWREACRMLERERDAVGVGGELIGTFAPTVASGLHRLAEDRRVDLLVVGSCARRGFERLLHGDDTCRSLAGAPCSVAVAPNGYAERPRPLATIGVAYNDTREADAALTLARGLAARDGLPVRALTVVSPLPASAGSAGYLDGGWGGMIDVLEQVASHRIRRLDGVEGRFVVGFASEELLAFAEEVDLLVIGSRGHGPLRRLILGSTSARLSREARCPLLVVPEGSGSGLDACRRTVSSRAYREGAE